MIFVYIFFESIGLVYAETATLFIMKLLNVTLNKMGGLNYAGR